MDLGTGRQKSEAFQPRSHLFSDLSESQKAIITDPVKIGLAMNKVTG